MKHMSARKFHLQTITRKMTISSHLSMRDARMVVAIAEGWISFNLKTLSITDSSVDVVSMPQKEHQSFTTMPAAITSEPRLTVPAYNTHCNTLTLCVASYPPHRYITHQLKPFTHQCNILWHMHCNYINILPILTININPLPVQFKALLHGQKGCVFFSGHLNLRTAPETGLPSREKNHNN